jgi:hypothetical protein
MPQLLFADNFLAGSLLTLLMPVLLLSTIAVWYLFQIKRVPKDTPTTSSALPSREVLAAADQPAESAEPPAPAAGA